MADSTDQISNDNSFHKSRNPENQIKAVHAGSMQA